MKTWITLETLLTLAYFWWRGILVDIHFKILVILNAFS